MIKSMTGYGRGEYRGSDRSFSVELRSVNHRYLETSVKLPRRFAFAEEDIKKEIKSRISRGKLDVFVNYAPGEESESDIRVDVPLALKYREGLEKLRDSLPGVEGSFSLMDIAGMPDVITEIPAEDDMDEVKEQLLSALGLAIDSFEEMRAAEGARLLEDVLLRADIIENTVAAIEEYAPAVEKLYFERLSARIEELIGGAGVEAARERILTEAAVFADKANITEEIVRLRSHVKQLRDMTSDPAEPVGKKLDFLVQEMNRESNTIGSKANDIKITEKVLVLKAEIEKIREQIQNVE
ncbi:MAG: YicC family protein [Firmicutes bacterium]|nr:YicC family protein [Bacillota bacterium]